MKTLDTLQKLKPVPTIFEVYFFSPLFSWNIFDCIFTKGLIDYNTMLYYRSPVVHIAVRLGDYIYETTDEGTVRYDFNEGILEHERLVSFFSVNLKSIERSRVEAAYFVLEQQIGKKLDITGSLAYLFRLKKVYSRFSKLYRSEEMLDFFMHTNARQNQVSVKPCSLTVNEEKLVNKEDFPISFNLPYTCTSPANVVLYHLLGYEPSVTGHLPGSLFTSLSAFQELGFGELFDVVYE